MKKVLLAVALALPLAVFSQWKTTSLGNAVVKQGKEKIEAAGLYSFDGQVFKQQLANVPERFSGQSGKIISIPNVEGMMERFEVWEASNFQPELQAKFPDIRSYIGIGIDDPTAYLRFSLSPQGIQTMTLRAGQSEFIEPYTEDNSRYIVFNSKKHRELGAQAFECTTEETTALSNELMDLVDQNSGKSSAGVFKTFLLAQSCTGEYGVYFGGTVAGAMAGINATLTRVNGVFEKDLAVNLILVANNELVIFTDPNTDPYSPPSGMGSWPSQLKATLDSVIGVNNYDIGHLYGRSGGGGNAGCIGCICNNPNKGTGYTSPGTGGPEGDNFDIDYVAHEYGHQIGANHTFSHGYEGTGANVEPGSGSTIMSYAGITGQNVQAHSDDYFVYKSIEQIQANLQYKACANNTTITGNGTPTANAGSNYDIPKGTAFKLTGEATDPDGDVLLYNWEQADSGTNATTGNNSRVGFTKTIGPNFRSNPHLTVPTRYFPRFDYVLTTDPGENETYWKGRWEAITTVPRTFNFKFTVRDNNPAGPQTATSAMKVTVANAGPFKISNPIEGQTVAINSGTMLVEWDVNGTDTAPISTANVRILFSQDNGTTFTVVKDSTPNDGSEVISLPEGTVAGTNARVMVEAIDNVYYAVSRKFNLSGVMGVSDVDQFAVGIYPNPNNGQFFVKAANISAGNVTTTIFDTAGRTVYSQDLNHFGGNYSQSYNVKLPTGVYMIVIQTADSKTTQKLIIK
ncbi:MAG: T9SS type A sorting domain-containing protein [Flavobacteriia bacterium]|nr:T9SS type A sorting domain-containing protein [Flavobacteriia bacterium]